MCEACRNGGSMPSSYSPLSVALPVEEDSASLSTSTPGPGRPHRGELIIRNAYVITMDETLGDQPSSSVHVRDGAIFAIGKEIRAEGGREIDGTGMIVLPGLIDTHWHMWHTILRSFSGDTKETGFYPTITRFAASMSPDDMHASTKLAATEAVHAGITTVHDWCHNIRGREHAEADVRALADVGLRARWSFGQRIDQLDSEPIQLAILEAMHGEWERHSNGGLIDLGMGWRGLYRSEWLPEAVYRPEFEMARHLGIPISAHIASIASRTGHVALHAKAGFLGPDVNIVHACGASTDEIAMIRDSGASVSLTILSELRGGWGVPKLSEMLKAGIPVAAGVDTAPLVGEANLFKIMAVAVAMENGIAQDEFRMSPRQALRLCTIDAARVLGIQDRVGSLTPGKRADLIMISTDALNMAPLNDPIHAVVECARPENVDTVVVDGAILKIGGKLAPSIDPTSAIANARRSAQEVRERAAWR